MASSTNMRNRKPTPVDIGEELFGPSETLVDPKFIRDDFSYPPYMKPVGNGKNTSNKISK